MTVFLDKRNGSQYVLPDRTAHVERILPAGGMPQRIFMIRRLRREISFAGASARTFRRRAFPHCPSSSLPKGRARRTCAGGRRRFGRRLPFSAVRIRAAFFFRFFLRSGPLPSQRERPSAGAAISSFRFAPLRLSDASGNVLPNVDSWLRAFSGERKGAPLKDVPEGRMTRVLLSRVAFRGEIVCRYWEGCFFCSASFSLPP